MAGPLEPIIGVFRRCLGKFITSVPPEPAAEVKKLLFSLHMTPKHVKHIHKVFLQLKEHDPLTVTSGPNEVSADSVRRLVNKRREWMDPILKNLLDLGGFRQTITWDGFLFVFLRLCTLSKIELCQVMFFIIAKEVKSWSVHYLTSTQLQEFYDFYDSCPVMSFNTQSIDFSTMAHAKFSMLEFVELCHNYSQLINPCIYFQRCLQLALPHIGFWNDYDHVQQANRKITLDFFIYSQGPWSSGMLAQVLVHRMAEVESQEKDKEGSKHDAAHDEDRIQLPLPLGFIPPPRKRRQTEAEVPLWLQQINRTNMHPLTGTSLGTGAKPTVPQIGQKSASAAWPPKHGALHETKTVEEACAGIKETFGLSMVALKAQIAQQKRTKAVREGLTTKIQAHVRSQELEFIKRSRESIMKHDNVVSILERSCPCELLRRPEKLVMGHT